MCFCQIPVRSLISKVGTELLNHVVTNSHKNNYLLYVDLFEGYLIMLYELPKLLAVE